MTHIIRQQYLYVDLNGTESDGMALQRQLSDVCQNWLIPAIERVLDRCAPSDGHLIIDRLDIDAGVLNLDRLEQDITLLVEQALEQALRQQTPTSEQAPAKPVGAVTRKTNQQTVFDAFIHFLKTGTLPWSFRLPTDKTLEQALLDAWETELESAMEQRRQNQALRSILSAVPVRQRLTRQFSTAFRTRLLSRINPVAEATVTTLLSVLNYVYPRPESVALFERGLWETAFAHTATNTAISGRQLVREAWQALPNPMPSSDELAHGLEQYWPGVTQTIPAENKSAEQETTGQPTDHPATNQETDLPQRLTDNTRLSQPFDTNEGLYIDNAGLILLHPFLAQFFGALGVAADGQLTQPERALCLLHFLATGQAVAPEHELLFPKLLCNVPFETPVEADVTLTPNELEEADGLLEAVVHHWEALRNTSPDALRGTFLIRPGKLTLRPDGDWLLQVESQPYDILLDQLPWGIAMVKLPWMDRLLRVEWR
ncbi:contractile injection system tape measure protein [Spirosoma sp.]|uniref:contractile injection system tape measure protein n=1 Tax=Spirosoma sp. TaxID=1899569 RepID=UPI00261444E3|nr:contractile injection system tape measure protein [Spirosoma sp.]MCX6218601.1 contractile injection system tape measure protein [Spirosoma sp.]